MKKKMKKNINKIYIKNETKIYEMEKKQPNE